MRTRLLALSLAAALGACGNDSQIEPTPDADMANRPEPRVIAGGGIGDGPIEGVANLYVIDDHTRLPISGAEVQVGSVTGITDATGLFVAEGVEGPQTVTAKANGYRSEVWIGAAGANMTMNLIAANAPSPGRADLTGQVLGIDQLQVPQGHFKAALVMYSARDELGDESNEITQSTEGQNLCVAGQNGCTFTITTRTGQVALLAAIVDVDPMGNADPADDTISIIGYAQRTGIMVQDGVNQSNVDLSLIPASMMHTVTVDFGTPPSGLGAQTNTLGGIVGIEVAGDGVLQLLPAIRTPADRSLLVPKLEAFSGATYRLTAIATDMPDPATRTSIVLRRGLDATTLAAGEWLAPPASPTVSRTSISWSAVRGATVYGAEFKQGATRSLNVTVLDGSTSATIPSAIVLPSGELTVDVTAIGAPGLDVASFSLDADRGKLATIAGQNVTLN